ncbi:bifunctional diguanylate cyclase/phosphodiesterase [Actinotalea sp. K2]|uniref:putative bifunctional diguanylate cyclase/phosphodiesterase n=1 Tax=Actinotalea sp. K2 TaxID=2939438 RepID=UPI00201739A4|nr:EAL domain-containing protein [Actinotalea sp. K2]MCL3859523.1 EAL domain-containing protein [Actinotalea sp. K2]
MAGQESAPTPEAAARSEQDGRPAPGPIGAEVDVIAELRARVRQQEAVAELGQLAMGTTDMCELLPRVAHVVRHTLRASRVGVLELQADGLLDRTADPPVVLGFDLIRGTTLETALATGRPAHVHDYDLLDATEMPPLRAINDVASAVSVPIDGRDGLWGILVVSHREAGGIGTQELLFLQQVTHLVGSAVERSRSDARIRHQALHDALTGLPNRVLLRRQVDGALSQRPPVSCAVLMLDLDGFKDVNDALGHAVGDQVLVSVAVRLEAIVGTTGVLARLGGDEFAVLQHAATWESAADLARQVRSAFAHPFRVGDLTIPLSASVGIALSPEHGDDTSTLLRRADVAMYRAKVTRAGWAGYDHDLDRAQTERLTVIGELRRAVTVEHGGDPTPERPSGDGHLTLHFQPVVDLRTGEPWGTEALVRWQHPRRGLVPPLDFIGLAEQSRVIGPLTVRVIDEALRLTGDWAEAGLRTGPVAVNVSMHCLSDAATFATIRHRLLEARDRLVVEVTESSLADSAARAALRDLAAEGVVCAIDDFGTGYSSLVHLRDLPVRTLKVDRTFVRDLATSSRDRAIVRAVVDLAEAMGLGVVAEGIETPEVAAILVDLGVERGQGFWWARPMPAGEMVTWWSGRARAARSR